MKKPPIYWYIIGFLFVAMSVFVALLAALAGIVLLLMFATWTIPPINPFMHPITYMFIRGALLIAIACGTAHSFSKENRESVRITCAKHRER
jgi:hypothetical protein